jgi:glycosyltransferase involved in cell wall biosynthesis
MIASMNQQVTIIISVYDHIVFLKAVLESIESQSFQDFEIIISEDGQHREMKAFLENRTWKHPWQHLTQQDTGWRKNKALNRAIMASSHPYLIFIDGDCILHPRFVEMHVKYAKNGRFLGGKRVKLSPEITQEYLNQGLRIHQLPWHVWKSSFSFNKQPHRFPEEGLFINPSGPLGFIPAFRSISELRGCNMSMFKKDLLAINGFDEDYTLPAIGEDIDLTWRMKKLGLELYSVRNLAVVFHLYHKENWLDQEINLSLLQQKQNKGNVNCLHGIINLERSR